MNDQGEVSTCQALLVFIVDDDAAIAEEGLRACYGGQIWVCVFGFVFARDQVAVLAG